MQNCSSRTTTLRQTLLYAACTALLALVLALVAAPSTALAYVDTGADGSDGAENTVTLTIVKGANNALVNKSYEFVEGSTLGDLFATAEKAGDIADYQFVDSGYGSYLNSITFTDGTVLKNASDYSTYWANYKNGTYSQGVTDSTEGDVINAGDAFQFSWEESYPKVTPTQAQWTTLSNSATPGGNVGEGGSASVTLTIVNGVSSYTGPNAVVNKSYSFNADKKPTIKDLFEAAKNAGDISDYFFGNEGGGALVSVTLNNGTTLATDIVKFDYYWDSYMNGGSDECYDTQIISNAAAYQFAWVESTPLISPTSDQWDTLSNAAVASDKIVGDTSDDSGSSTNPDADKKDAEKTSDKSSGTTASSSSKLAQTGDQSGMVLIAASIIAVVAAAGLGTVLVRRKNAHKE